MDVYSRLNRLPYKFLQVGFFIQAMRRYLNLTKINFAGKIGVDVCLIKEVEENNLVLSPAAALKIIHHLGIDPIDALHAIECQRLRNSYD